MRKLIFLFALFQLGFMLNAQQLKVSTYNIRNANFNDSINGNGWHQRCPVICDIIQYNDFDIVGLQEVLDRQRIDLIHSLSQYNHIGVGRDDGKTKGEYASILYKKDKFEELQSGHFWLSENTGYPNTGWDAKYPRICIWTQLKEKDNGKIIWFYNLHLDHIGIKARRESCKLVLQKIKKEVAVDEACILTGDFNVDQNNEIYNIIENSGVLRDSYNICEKRYATNGTFNGFNPDHWSVNRIDHIFISNNLNVLNYKVLTDIYWIQGEKNKIRLPSDHFPVSVSLMF